MNQWLGVSCAGYCSVPYPLSPFCPRCCCPDPFWQPVWAHLPAPGPDGPEGSCIFLASLCLQGSFLSGGTSSPESSLEAVYNKHTCIPDSCGKAELWPKDHYDLKCLSLYEGDKTCLFILKNILRAVFLASSSHMGQCCLSINRIWHIEFN